MEWWMRITGSTGPGSKPSLGGTAPAAAPGFSLAGPAAPARPPAASAPLAAAALLALQDMTIPVAAERRRALARGRSLLDRLDELHLGLLDGAVPVASLNGLRAELGPQAGCYGDAPLAALLASIDVRCAVELAKLEVTGALA
jgi:hypothetical protein